MRFLVVVWFAFVLAFGSIESQAFENISHDLDSIIVKDLKNKKTIYAKDANREIQPASLTKIMTAIMAIESGKLNSTVTITHDMTQVEPTRLGLRVGEKVKLKDLVHAALIKSANDSAKAIAIYLGGGSEAVFVKAMNKKAKKLGMKNTHFTNPCGFDKGDHHSTAKDLLRLSEYAIKDARFNKIVKLNQYSFKTLNTKRRYTAHTSNRLQRSEKYVVGIKTGYTHKAGPCLIARAKKNNKDILLVMLNSNNRWANAKKALEVATKAKASTKQHRARG